MEQDEKTGRVTLTIQEIAHYNMMLTEAIFELLAEKGILTGVEVKERVQKLKAETHLAFRWLQWAERLFVQEGNFKSIEIADTVPRLWTSRGLCKRTLEKALPSSIN